MLSFRGALGVTGTDTPVFENYFAGGYNTIRGFRYRGASPVDMGTIVGGRFQLLTSIQYMAPIKADDTFRWVAFVDGGTITPNLNISSQAYRVAPGFGLRINVPGMGPAPIALDFAFPISLEPTDQRQTFSFFMGFQQ